MQAARIGADFDLVCTTDSVDQLFRFKYHSQEAIIQKIPEFNPDILKTGKVLSLVIISFLYTVVAQ